MVARSFPYDALKQIVLNSHQRQSGLQPEISSAGKEGCHWVNGGTWSLDPPSPTCANHKFRSTPCAPSINGWRSLPESAPTVAWIPKLQRDGQQTAERINAW